MDFTITKEFIIEAHKAACSDWKNRIEKEFPEAFPKLEIGKWYKNGDSGWEKSIGCVVKVDPYDKRMFSGYGFTRSGEWCEDENTSAFGSKNWTPATDKEVEEALIAEAKKRFGHDWRIAKIKPMAGDHGGGYNKEQFGVCVCDNEIWNRNGCIFKYGKWATIIPEEKTVITKEKALKILAKKYGTTPENIEIQ